MLIKGSGHIRLLFGFIRCHLFFSYWYLSIYKKVFSLKDWSATVSVLRCGTRTLSKKKSRAPDLDKNLSSTLFCSKLRCQEMFPVLHNPDPCPCCSVWLRLKLITKVSLHTFPPPDPPFLPPQTFSPFIVMEKAQQV